VVEYSTGQFTGILIYSGVFIAPVLQFHCNGTGYDQIPPDIKSKLLFVQFIDINPNREALLGGNTGESGFLCGKVCGWFLLVEACGF